MLSGAVEFYFLLLCVLAQGMIVRHLRKHDDHDVSSLAGVLYVIFHERALARREQEQAEKKKKRKREADKEEKR